MTSDGSTGGEIQMMPWRSERKRRWIAAQPCLITGAPAQCAHVGGLAEGKGAALKCGDEFTIPLSPAVHDMFDGRRKLPNGRIGKNAFEAHFRIDSLACARIYHQRWLNDNGSNGSTKKRA